MFFGYHNNYLYSIVEMQRHALEPYRQVAHANKDFYNSFFSGNKYGRSVAASFELFERVTRKYEKPAFNITKTQVNGKTVEVEELVVKSKTFCKLLHFKKSGNHKLPKMLVVAPVSGHHATLLRGTVEGLLPHFDVYITDWVNARDVPVADGSFKFDDFVAYTTEFIRKLGPNLNVMAVCQPSVPVSASVAMMSEAKDPCVPDTLILIGGPIDTRKNPTEVNDYAAERTINWFENNVITRVPLNYPGAGRLVYPGFMQLFGFMAMNMQTHMEAHVDLFNHLVEGDGESAEAHRKFYNEYLSVMDMPEEFYLETVNIVFKKHLLPRSKLICDGKVVKLSSIKKSALLCLEGEKDDISGRGQTKAAIDLCTNIPANRKHYHLQKDVGHYGLFNGRRYREKIVPLITKFVQQSTKASKPTAAKPAAKKPTAAKTVAKKTVAKKSPAVKKTVAAKAVTKKPAVKKTTVTKKPATKAKNKVAAKSATVKKAAAPKKPVAKKSTPAKSTAAKKPQIKAASPKVVSLKKVAEAKKKAKAASKPTDKTKGKK